MPLFRVKATATSAITSRLSASCLAYAHKSFEGGSTEHYRLEELLDRHTNNARLLLINLMPSSKLLIPATLAIATGGGGGIVAAKLARADARLITPMVYRIEPVNIFPFSSACMPFSVSRKPKIRFMAMTSAL